MAGRNFLFVPGPSNVPDRVLRSMMVAMEDHRSSKFPELTRSLFPDLKRLFQCTEGEVFIFPATGTGGWEAALTNTLAPGDRLGAPSGAALRRCGELARQPRLPHERMASRSRRHRLAERSHVAGGPGDRRRNPERAGSGKNGGVHAR